MGKVSEVLLKKHYARRNWDCVLCHGTIEKGDVYRYVYLEGTKTARHACINCSNPIVREQTIRRLAEVTGKPVEQVRKAWEKEAMISVNSN